VGHGLSRWRRNAATGGASVGAGGGSTTQQPTTLESQQSALAVRTAELQRRVGGDITDPNTFANTPFARAGKGYDLANANKAAGLLKKQQQAIGARIKAIRKGLGRKGITKATKVRLQNELAQLIPQHAQLGQQRQAILHPQAPDTGGGGLATRATRTRDSSTRSTPQRSRSASTPRR
jgi:hypothetical protein